MDDYDDVVQVVLEAAVAQHCLVLAHLAAHALQSAEDDEAFDDGDRDEVDMAAPQTSESQFTGSDNSEKVERRHKRQRDLTYVSANWTDEEELERKRVQKVEAEEAEHFNRREVRHVQKKAVAREAARRSMSTSGTAKKELEVVNADSAEQQADVESVGGKAKRDKKDGSKVHREGAQGEVQGEKFLRKSARAKRRSKAMAKRREAKAKVAADKT